MYSLSVRKKRESIIKKNIQGRSYLKKICCSYIILSIFVIANALPPVIRVGAIFTEDERESSIESAFKYAIYRINKEKSLLPNTQLVYDIEYVPRDDSFRTTKKVCSQLEAGVQAIFGPTDALLASHVQSICEAYDIPHIEGRIDLEYNSKEFSINLYPSHTLLTLAYRDIMAYLNWTKVAIIYEEDYGGVFVVLLCGLALAVVVAIFEFCWNSRKNLNTENQSLCSEMAEELRFAMHCHGSKSKHRPRKRNCLNCSSVPTYVPSNVSTSSVGVYYNYFN
ncbi:GD24422 [Drosophila simulans]|uniref:GD24422 n=1 Tax=Drosophila simulans TaxID=7240 RepID=B4R2I9_DROSI|nr:GD24422 [Drosophila simulans]